jgi:hypothetical protein
MQTNRHITEFEKLSAPCEVGGHLATKQISKPLRKPKFYYLKSHPCILFLSTILILSTHACPGLPSCLFHSGSQTVNFKAYESLSARAICYTNVILHFTTLIIFGDADPSVRAF